MIKLNHNISLDLYYNEEKTIDTKEYDKNSRYITVHLTYKGEKYTISGDNIKATIKWLKPDKKAVFNDCIINSDNTITINLTEQMLIVSGVAKATLTLYDIANDQVLSTTSFNAIIEASAVQNETIMSSDEYDTLNKMILDEDKRIEAVKELDKMVTEHETIRESNENNRKSNEETRQNNENERIDAESIRITNENKRIEAEKNRINAENARKDNELTRQSNEEQRKSNEIVRENNEENRITAFADMKQMVTDMNTTISQNKSVWDDKYTKNEVDNKFSTLETNINWKESVNTYQDIASTYPNPQDGWTVNVKDTDYTYRYNGTNWVTISANAIPKATNSVDGLLSKEDHANYEDANSKKHTHNNKSVIDGISSTNVSNWNSAKTHADSTHARTDATKVEKSSTNGNIKINGTETTVYTHPSGTNPHGTTKSDVGLGNVGNFKAVSTVASQGLTDTEKSNARANIGAGTSSFSGSYNDLTNKPTIPTVGNGTITIKQAGTSKGTFAMNQSGNTTIELTDNNTTYSSKSAASGGTDVSLVTTGEKYTWNNKANASHGNHVPATQTANNATFLRNDNTWQKVTPANIGAAASSHTHSYAGSSSAGGSAISAVKLDSSAGSATQPVYFSGGKPVACTYTLGKSVPSNAVFTDTHYTSKNVVGSATTSTSNTSSALTNGNVYLNNIENNTVTSSHKISGSGATTVKTDANGNIIISSTDTNTTYGVATTSENGLMSSTDKTKLNNVLKYDKDGDLVVDGNGYITLTCDYNIIFDGAGKALLTETDFSPNRTNINLDLGSSAMKWNNIYAKNGTIQTSDRNQKNSIEDLTTETAKAFIYGLKPSTYKMDTGTSGRTHWGLISQDVEELMSQLGIDSLDFAGFIKSPKKVMRYEDENGNELKKPIEETVEGEYDYSLRYDEFIAPLIKVVQVQQQEIDSLKEDIDEMKRNIT